jgi:hypothetical protein
MHIDPPAVAPAESYPTFWNDAATAPAPTSQVIPAEDAYITFVNLTEEGLPTDSPKAIVPDID